DVGSHAHRLARKATAASRSGSGSIAPRQGEAREANSKRPAAFTVGRLACDTGRGAWPGAASVPFDTAHRGRPVVEHKHHRVQFHSSAVFPVPDFERDLLG